VSLDKRLTQLETVAQSGTPARCSMADAWGPFLARRAAGLPDLDIKKVEQWKLYEQAAEEVARGINNKYREVQ